MNKRLIRLATFLFFGFICVNGNSQNLKAYFKNDTIRFESASNKVCDSFLTIIIPKDQAQKKGKLLLNILKEKTTVEISKIKVPPSNEFKWESLTDTVKFTYDFSVPRDMKDDRQVVFDIDAFDSTGKRIPIEKGDTVATVYIKPYQNDTLSSNDNWEFWLFTGTNFDVFDGVKPQEFFFRANTILHLSESFYLQAGFYRNRYFIADSTSNSILLQRGLFRSTTDSTYSFRFGSYQTKIKQTFDPVGLSLDVMYKLSSSKEKKDINYFATIGFDLSTVTVTIQNSFSNFDTISFKTKNADTSIRSANPFPPERFTYKNKIGNFNVGFMFIIDDKKFNIKGNLTAGKSFFTRPLVFYTRSGIATYQNLSELYLQTRLFATYKPVGISIGFETFSREKDFTAFNVTLSKVFDLEGFFKILSPVSSLSDNK